LYDSIWKDGYRYAKAGIMLGDFCSPDDVQFDLFDSDPTDQRSDTLMQAIDAINHKGSGKIWFGGQRKKQDWFMRQANVSPAYTTRWDSIPDVK
jgi:DNA polymerase V